MRLRSGASEVFELAWLPDPQAFKKQAWASPAVAIQIFNTTRLTPQDYVELRGFLQRSSWGPGFPQSYFWSDRMIRAWVEQLLRSKVLGVRSWRRIYPEAVAFVPPPSPPRAPPPPLPPSAATSPALPPVEAWPGNAALQAQALIRASEEGAPFCEECERRKAAQA